MTSFLNSFRIPHLFYIFQVHYVKPIAREGKDGKQEVSKDQV